MGVLRKGLTMINPTILLWGWDERNIKTLPWEGGLDPDRISRSTELVDKNSDIHMTPRSHVAMHPCRKMTCTERSIGAAVRRGVGSRGHSLFL